MPCLVALIAFFFPRLAIVLLWLTSDYLSRAFATVVWPVLGFFLMPLTTLAYAWAYNSGGGHVQGVGLAVVVIAVLVDLGSCGHGASTAAKRRG